MGAISQKNSRLPSGSLSYPSPTQDPVAPSKRVVIGRISARRLRLRYCLTTASKNQVQPSLGCRHSGYLAVVLREIRRLGSGFSQVDSVFLKKKSAGCLHRVRTRLCNFYGKRSRPGKTPTLHVGFGVGPLPSAKHKCHIHNSLDATITAV